MPYIKTNHIQYKPNMGFQVFQICLLIMVINQYFQASESKSSMIIFTGSDSISASLSRFTTMVIPDTRKRNGKKGGGRLFEGTDCFKHFGQRGEYPREAIYRGTTIIQGHTVIQNWLEFTPVPLFYNLVLPVFFNVFYVTETSMQFSTRINEHCIFRTSLKKCS